MPDDPDADGQTYRVECGCGYDERFNSRVVAQTFRDEHDESCVKATHPVAEVDDA